MRKLLKVLCVLCFALYLLVLITDIRVDVDFRGRSDAGYVVISALGLRGVTDFRVDIATGRVTGLRDESEQDNDNIEKLAKKILAESSSEQTRYEDSEKLIKIVGNAKGSDINESNISLLIALVNQQDLLNSADSANMLVMAGARAARAIPAMEDARKRGKMDDDERCKTGCTGIMSNDYLQGMISLMKTEISVVFILGFFMPLLAAYCLNYIGRRNLIRLFSLEHEDLLDKQSIASGRITGSPIAFTKFLIKSNYRKLNDKALKKLGDFYLCTMAMLFLLICKLCFVPSLHGVIYLFD